MQAGSRLARVVKLLSARLRASGDPGTLLCKAPGSTECIAPYLCYPSSYATVRLGARRYRCFYDPDRDAGGAGADAEADPDP